MATDSAPESKESGLNDLSRVCAVVNRFFLCSNALRGILTYQSHGVILIFGQNQSPLSRRFLQPAPHLSLQFGVVRAEEPFKSGLLVRNENAIGDEVKTGGRQQERRRTVEERNADQPQDDS